MHTQQGNTIPVYCWDSEYRYTHAEFADEDTQATGPFREFIMPPNSTKHEPPFANNLKQSPFWNPEKKQWQIATDERKIAAAAANARDNRNRLLYASDWTQLPDAKLNSEQVDKWREYRQQLRDLPEHTEWPFVTLPLSPAEKEVRNG